MTVNDRLSSALADRYRIERELGAGGMATVYLAADVKHDRKVAIKVLKPELAAVLGAERFVQEIKTTAALSHPHILPLFDSGEAGGFLYYVMPFIEGETIRDRLNRETQLGIEEAVKITTEAADALDYAHRHGVIHRDIKPENILLHDGRPMVMDFGIALAVSAAAGGRMTETGLSLGTPHYMSPEQATAEKEITGRSDIYSLATVLYEMLAGVPPHEGGSAQQTIMRIITDVPRPVTELRKSVPPHVAAALAKALEKLPADRFASARAFADALGSPTFGAGPGITGYGTGAGHRSRRVDRRILATVAVAALALGIVATTVALGFRSTPPRTARLMLQLPDQDLPAISSGTPVIALSPHDDGFLYWRSETTSQYQLMFRSWDRISATRLRHQADYACCVAFSPRGDSLAYLTPSTRLLVAPVAGGIPRAVADSGLTQITYVGGGVDWGDDGWLYASGMAGLVRVSPDGGPMELAAPLDTGRGDGMYAWPSVLPQARGVLVTVLPLQGLADPTRSSIGVVDLSTGRVRVLLQGVRALYAPTGHLVVAKHDGSLWAVPFDAKTLRVGGSERALPDTAAFVLGAGDLELSPGGTLAYIRSAIQSRQPVLVDRTGAWRPVSAELLSPLVMDPALSNDGRRLAVTLGDEDGRMDLWITPIDGGSRSRLTLEGSNNFRSAWRPQTGRISYTSMGISSPSSYELFERAGDGSGSANRIDAREDRPIMGHTWSPDGRWLVYRTDDQVAGNGDIMGLRPGIDSVPTPLVATEATEMNPAVSPDGRWLAYTSNESGRVEVWVVPFPSTSSGKYQVSLEGGSMPAWSPTGRELFYVDAQRRMIAVPVASGPGFQRGTAEVLFSAAEFYINSSFPQLDVLPDGRTFVMIRSEQDAEVHVVVVFNFLEELKRIMANR
jgi:serine/threonine-protein kinase